MASERDRQRYERALLDYYADHDELPSYFEAADDPHLPSPGDVIDAFDLSYSQVLGDIAGRHQLSSDYAVRRGQRFWNQDLIARRFLLFYQERGELPSLQEARRDPRMPGQRTVVRHFDKPWSEVMAEIASEHGLESVYTEPGGRQGGQPESWTRDDLEAAVVDFAEAHDEHRVPTTREAKEFIAHPDVFVHHFGKPFAEVMDDLSEKYGLGDRVHYTRWTEDSMAEAIVEFYERNARWPTAKEAKPANGLPWNKTVKQQTGLTFAQFRKRVRTAYEA